MFGRKKDFAHQQQNLIFTIKHVGGVRAFISAPQTLENFVQKS